MSPDSHSSYAPVSAPPPGSRGKQHPLPPQPRRQRSAYATKAVGKMHFTPTYLDVGFSELELAEQDGPGRWDDVYHRYLRRLGLVDANDLEDQRAEYSQRRAGG